MLASDTLTAIETCSRLARPEQILDTLSETLTPLGVDFFCFIFFPRENEKFEDVVLTCRVPPDWLALYTSRDFCRHDPANRHGQRVAKPFAWRDAPFNPEYETRAREVVERAVDFRVANGAVVPIHGPAGPIGNVWMAGYNFELTERDAPTLHILGLYAFERLRILVGPKRPGPRKLTARERDILTWVAKGKSYWEIGSLLRLSDRTVEFHVKQACVKLQTSNRAHAVAVALREGAIKI